MFGEAMEYFQTALRKYWPLRMGKQCTTKAVYNGDMGRCWRRLRILWVDGENRINSAVLWGNRIWGFWGSVQVSDVVKKKLLCGWATMVYEICPECIKALNVMGSSRGTLEVCQPVHMCFVGMQQAWNCFPLKVLWGMFASIRYRTFSACPTGVRVWSGLPAVSQILFQCTVRQTC